MRRKEQEARIEQQRQEKEKAREDAARERARSAETNPQNMDTTIAALFPLEHDLLFPLIDG